MSLPHRIFRVLLCSLLVLTACSRDTTSVDSTSTPNTSSHSPAQAVPSISATPVFTHSSAQNKIDVTATFDLVFPDDWSVSYDRIQPNRSRILSIDAQGDALVNIELFSKQQVLALSSNDTLGLDAYILQYNKTSQAFAVLSSTEFSPRLAPISRLGLSGLREDADVEMAGIDASYIKEFYVMDFENGDRGFVVVEASPEEFQLIEKDLETLLQQLINYGR